MAASASFLDFMKEAFAPFGAIAARRMFGGAGVYCDDLFFTIVADDAVYLKVDDETRAAFESRGLERFAYEMKDGRVGSLPYYSAPEEIFDDEEELRRWTGYALDAARRAAKFKKPRRKRVR